MKLADSEPLQQDYFYIADPWRQEWEKGVQVPVNPGEIPDINVKTLHEKPLTGDFKIPRKFLHAMQDETYRQGMHELTGMHQLSEQVVRYDLDDLDVSWLQLANDEREEMGLQYIHEWTMERIIEALESHCHEKIKNLMKTEEGLGIEYDEDIVCEVCRSPDSEESNEMVFCDGCDICVHQACYGIQKIPEGRWLCRTCSLGMKPMCILCPKSGGAMKSTKSGTKWAHVSCALWIPEVSIGCVEKMEPITKISNIPASRWALVCCVCKDRIGACIQCSVKTCKTAFHVTCAIFNGLEMKTILDETDEQDGVKLKAFCPRHSKRRERSQSDSEADSPRKEIPLTPRKDLSKEEMANLRAKKLSELQDNFYKVVDAADIAEQLCVEEEVVEMVAVFWKCKRKCNFNKPLLMPKTEEADMLEKQQEDSLVARMKMFVHLRQDLERVRNLCYMISRREKTKRQYYKARETAFLAAVRAITDERQNLSNREAEKVANMYNKDSLYDGVDLEPVKSKGVRNLSSHLEKISVSPPRIADDLESIDSDTKEYSSSFRGRLSSKGSSTGVVEVLEKERLYDYDETDIGSDESKHNRHESVDKYTKREDSASGKEGGKYQRYGSIDKQVEREERHNLGDKYARRGKGRGKHHRHESVEHHGGKVGRGSKGGKHSRHDSRGGKEGGKGKGEVGRRHGRDLYSEEGGKDGRYEIGHGDSGQPAEVVQVGRGIRNGKGEGERCIKQEVIMDNVENELKSVKEEPVREEREFNLERDKSSKERGEKEGSTESERRTRDRSAKVKAKVKVEPDSESQIVDVVEMEPVMVDFSADANIVPKEENIEVDDVLLDTQIKTEDSVSIDVTVERPRRSLREKQVDTSHGDSGSNAALSSPDDIVVVETVKSEVKEKHRRHGHKHHKRGHRHFSAEKRKDRTSKDRKDYIRPEVNGLIRNSNLIVANSVKERVQNRLLKARRARYMNGVHDKSQRKIENYFATRSPDDDLESPKVSGSLKSGSRILNEISPDKGKAPFQNNLFGAHYTPKGSLSGYKIPKKAGSIDRTPLKVQSPCEKVDETRTFHFETRSRSKKVESVPLAPGVKRNIFTETGLDAVKLMNTEFSKEVELVSDSRGYRSHSPLSSEGTDSDQPRRPNSRESTPRRVTRSQIADVDENSVDSIHSQRSNMKVRLRDGWMRPANFTS